MRPGDQTPWKPLSVDGVAALFAETDARWWLSGGHALDRWLGRPVRERENIDVSTTSADVERLVAALPHGLSAWAPAEDGDDVVPWDDEARAGDPQPVRVLDEAEGAWVLQVNVEDGAPRAWLYKRDSRLSLTWDRAVQDIDGVPTGAPEVQLVWKALRPRPEDTTDKDAVLPHLSADAVSFYETALLRIHPHSTWAIHVRSPFAPAKASWNRRRPTSPDTPPS